MPDATPACQQEPRHHRLARRPPGRARTSSSSTARSICRRSSATPRPNFSPATFRARCSSTSTRSPTIPTDLPHMLPGPTQFAKDVGALGIGDDDTIVVYDGVGPRRRAAGVVDVPRSSAPRRSSSSTAACRSGRPKAARSSPARPSARRASSTPSSNTQRGRRRRRRAEGAARQDPRRWSMRAPADRFRGEAPEPRAGPARRPHAGRAQRAGRPS